MSLECERLLAGLGIPDLQRVVTAAADDPLPVGAETHANDRICVSRESRIGKWQPGETFIAGTQVDFN